MAGGDLRTDVTPPFTEVRRIDATRPEGDFPVAWCLSRAPWNALEEAKSRWLAGSEITALAQAGVPKRQAEALRGRLCAKLALRAWASELDPLAVSVEPGVFGQPVVRGLASGGRAHPQLSVAHSGDWAGALVTDEAHPMAIDIEEHDPRHTETIRREATAAELAAVAAGWVESDSRAMTLLWAAKEALAKVLRTGLTAPLSCYEISGPGRGAIGAFTCTYARFAQYRCEVAWIGNVAVAIVLPRKSVLPADWFLMRVPTE